MAQGFTNGVPYPLPVTKGGTGLVSATINQILWSSAANTIAGLATANSSVLVTSGAGVPSLATVLPSGISAPNFQCSTYLDTNGLNMLQFVATASAVNNISLTNAATGVAPILSATGSDAAVSMVLQTKGTGAINILSQALTIPLIIQSGTSSQHTANIAFTNAATTQTITFPDTNQTVTATAAALTNGQIPIGNTGNLPRAATLTAGTNVSITNAAGAITIAQTNNLYAISFIMSRGLY